MNIRMTNGKYVRQNFSTILPIDTLELLKTAAASQKKKIYELLDEIIIEHLSEGDSEHDNLPKSAK